MINEDIREDSEKTLVISSSERITTEFRRKYDIQPITIEGMEKHSDIHLTFPRDSQNIWGTITIPLSFKAQKYLRPRVRILPSKRRPRRNFTKKQFRRILEQENKIALDSYMDSNVSKKSVSIATGLEYSFINNYFNRKKIMARDAELGILRSKQSKFTQRVLRKLSEFMALPG